MNDKYRFDDAYQSVYQYNKYQKAYIHIGSYLAYGITPNMRESTKIRKVETA